ncbi:MAG: proteasome subunit beta [Nanoarchaeota archaeon]|nr:proteasome subunit beta [Nanoarchaeota archaeon]
MDNELKNLILKTGTSILGIACKDGVIMAADRQTSLGESIVASKKTLKVVKINDYVAIAEAGVVSDIQLLIKLLRAELRLKELKSRSRPTVKQSANLMASLVYNNIRKYSTIPGITAFLIAGFDKNGSTKLFSLDPAGALMEEEEYYSNGSGQTFILGLLERQYKKDMTIKQGVELAIECLKSSTQRDMGSGYGIDVFSITKDGIKREVSQEIQSVYKDE